MKVIVKEVISGKWKILNEFTTKKEFIEIMQRKREMEHRAWVEEGEEKLTDFEIALNEVIHGMKWIKVLCGNKEYKFHRDRKGGNVVESIRGGMFNGTVNN